MQIAKFKNMSVALKELEPFVRGGEPLLTGLPLKQLGGMRPREAWANWLICAVVNHEHHAERVMFASDPTGGDGILFDAQLGVSWPTEHIMVPRARADDSVEGPSRCVETRVLEAIGKKIEKGGDPYARGKHLIAFLDRDGGQWFPVRIVRELPEPLHFEDVWVVCLQSASPTGYQYRVTQLEPGSVPPPIWHVDISGGFDGWIVRREQ